MNRNITKNMCLCFLGLLLLTALPAGASEPETSGYTADECIECHRSGSGESELQISLKEYEASIHGQEATCVECHTGVKDEDHQTGAGPVSCDKCHEEQVNRHGGSMKTEADPEKTRQKQNLPRCHDCHTRHNMLAKDNPRATVHPDNLHQTCQGCHPATSSEKSFFSWFPSFQIASHNKSDFGAAYDKKNCLGCHQGRGAHGEETPINSQNCNKCHLSPDDKDALWGYMHPDIGKQPAIFASAVLYQFFAAGVFIILLGKLLNFIFDTLLTRIIKTRN